MKLKLHLDGNGREISRRMIQIQHIFFLLLTCSMLLAGLGAGLPGLPTPPPIPPLPPPPPLPTLLGEEAPSEEPLMAGGGRGGYSRAL